MGPRCNKTMIISFLPLLTHRKWSWGSSEKPSTPFYCPNAATAAKYVMNVSSNLFWKNPTMETPKMYLEKSTWALATFALSMPIFNCNRTGLRLFEGNLNLYLILNPQKIFQQYQRQQHRQKIARRLHKSKQRFRSVELNSSYKNSESRHVTICVVFVFHSYWILTTSKHVSYG